LCPKPRVARALLFVPRCTSRVHSRVPNAAAKLSATHWTPYAPSFQNGSPCLRRQWPKHFMVMPRPPRSTSKQPEKLDDGTLNPGICKVRGDKRWSIPVNARARALDEPGREDVAPSCRH